MPGHKSRIMDNEEYDARQLVFGFFHRPVAGSGRGRADERHLDNIEHTHHRRFQPVEKEDGKKAPVQQKNARNGDEVCRHQGKERVLFHHPVFICYAAYPRQRSLAYSQAEKCWPSSSLLMKGSSPYIM